VQCFALAIFLALFLASCAPSMVDDDAETALRAFAADDLRTAYTRASARNDVIAATCYERLLTLVEQHNADVVVHVVGPVTAFDSARAIRRRVDAGVSDETRLACAALVGETRASLVKIAVSLGVLP
jgi:hypothetical protein